MRRSRARSRWASDAVLGGAATGPMRRRSGRADPGELRSPCEPGRDVADRCCDRAREPMPPPRTACPSRGTGAELSAPHAAAPRHAPRQPHAENWTESGEGRCVAASACCAHPPDPAGAQGGAGGLEGLGSGAAGPAVERRSADGGVRATHRCDDLLMEDVCRFRGDTFGCGGSDVQVGVREERAEAAPRLGVVHFGEGVHQLRRDQRLGGRCQRAVEGRECAPRIATRRHGQ